MEMKQVPGEDRGDIILYALSTCGWCRKTKELLGELGAAYHYLDVDQVPAGEQDAVMAEVRRYNPSCTFPTVVIGGKAIIGFNEAGIREAVK